MSHTEDDRKKERTRPAGTGERHLAFQLAHEQYAIPLLHVREVIEMSTPTPIPQTPLYFKGVINLRGQMISVLDLRIKLQIANAVNGPKTAIIILDFDQASIGVIVDRINSVLAFQPQDISPAPANYAGTAQILTGVAHSGNKMTLILDMHAVLNGADIQLANSLANTNHKLSA